MRDAMKRLGGDPTKINPLLPAELVIDHSVQVDEFGTPQALSLNAAIEFQRNKERYAFLRWGQTAFRNFAGRAARHRHRPPGQPRVPGARGLHRRRRRTAKGLPQAYPDTLVGTDSHTTMVNGLGVLGWGVGGIEAEAAMLGQPMSMLIPQVVGFRLHGALREGSTATDLVLTVTEMLRKKGVVGKFVEFFGPGVAALSLADRATIANMAPEYGATCGIFPVDAETLRYLRFSGRPDEQVALVEAYAREQGLFHDPETKDSEYTDTVDLDLASVEPSVAGPEAAAGSREPVRDAAVVRAGAAVAGQAQEEGGAVALGRDPTSARTRRLPAVARGQERLGRHRRHHQLHQHVEPVGDGGGRPAGQEGGRARAVDQALGQDVAGARLEGRHRVPRRGRADALPREAAVQHRRLRLHDLHRQLRPAAGAVISQAIEERDLVVASVLSGNRNFEGRINPEVRANYLMSPPLVVAFALAGRIDIDLEKEPLGDRQGRASRSS